MYVCFPNFSAEDNCFSVMMLKVYMHFLNELIIFLLSSAAESMQAMDVCPRQTIDAFDVNQNILPSMVPISNCGTVSLSFSNHLNSLVGQVFLVILIVVVYSLSGVFFIWLVFHLYGCILCACGAYILEVLLNLSRLIKSNLCRELFRTGELV